ncbi:response regulator [Paraburkholderia bryophila]|uniref:response regulator transcription factor n=1 Tax=Burkholderiaceae TaxID=119060 RepID=UPI00054FEC7E|nr:response regulator [Burkholderia sp. 9120]
MSNPLIVSIIDDDESVRIATSSLVRSLGWDAHLFHSAEAFLASDDVGQTACVISDVQMPGMTGLDLLRKLIDQGYAPPFIFISAFRSDLAYRAAMAHGAICFLNKPVDGSVVAQCLAKLKNKRGDLIH